MSALNRIDNIKDESLKLKNTSLWFGGNAMFMAQLGAAHTTAICGSLACHGSLPETHSPGSLRLPHPLKQVEAAMPPRPILAGPEVK